MFIPDPIERMEMRARHTQDEFEELQHGVPDDSFRCPDCNQVKEGEPIQWGAMPDSPASCYDCMPQDLRSAYDRFHESRGRTDDH